MLTVLYCHSLAERYRVTGANDDLGDCLDDALQRMVKASQVDEGELRVSSEAL